MSAQMNTRIDDALKASGDAVFAEAGYSPSQVVRAVWGFASRNAGNAKAVADMLGELGEADASLAEERARKLKALEDSDALVDRLMEEHGLSWDEGYTPLPYGEMRDMSLAERYSGKGLL